MTLKQNTDVEPRAMNGSKLNAVEVPKWLGEQL